MNLSSSAQKLMDTLKRWTSKHNYTSVLDELEAIAEEPQEFDGRAVEGALGRMARRSGWWEPVVKGFRITMVWRDPREEHGVVPLGPVSEFEWEFDAD